MTAAAPPQLNAWSAFWRGVGVIFSLELRQRVRGIAWYVLLGVVFLLVGIVTALVFLAFALGGGDLRESGAGPTLFSIILFFVLLVTSLVTPALSGAAINSDRDNGTLATTQVTLVTTPQIVIGKFLAAWLTGLGYLAVSIPALCVALLLGQVPVDTIVVAVLVLAVEIGVIAAIGVGLSGLIRKPLFSVTVSYLVVAALSIGTLIAFALGGAVIQTPVTYHYETYAPGTQFDPNTGEPIAPFTCVTEDEGTYNAPRPDLVWGFLAANPYVVLADAVPPHFDNGEPTDWFGYVRAGVRMAQLPVGSDSGYSDCEYWANGQAGAYPTTESRIAGTTPSWFVGLLIHLVLAAAALVGAGLAIRTPARRMGKDSRVA